MNQILLLLCPWTFGSSLQINSGWPTGTFSSCSLLLLGAINLCVLEALLLSVFGRLVHGWFSKAEFAWRRGWYPPVGFGGPPFPSRSLLCPGSMQGARHSLFPRTLCGDSPFYWDVSCWGGGLSVQGLTSGVIIQGIMTLHHFSAYKLFSL